MGYAIRNDKQGWRAVASRDDVAEGEYYSPVPIEITPSQVTPERVTMRQARLALLGASLLDGVEAAISAMGDTPEGKAARIEWEYGSEVVRNSPFVSQLGEALGLSYEQIDGLFVTAAGID